MYINVICEICKEHLGAAHAQGYASMIRKHVTEKHPEAALEAADIEERIRSFKKRYGRNIISKAF